MYTSFYNLDSKPFETRPDPVYLWLGGKHKDALSVLRYGIFENKGFLVLTGDAGTGKTTLVNALTQSFDEAVKWAVISDPGLERLDFYNAIAKGFKLDKVFTSKVQFLIQFSQFLHKAHDENHKVLLLIDDCHRLSQDMLEELRLLSNIEKAEAKLINIFFVGRREFNDVLVQPNNRAVRQRLTLRAELTALSADETEQYIQHRLRTAGTVEKLFTEKAIRHIRRYSNGIPRLINIICDHAMVAGCVQGKRILDHKVLEECVEKLHLPTSPSEHDFAGLDDQKSHMEHFRGRFLPGTPESHTVGTGINLENDQRRWGWVKYALGVVLLFAAGVYFDLPEERPRDMVQVEKEPVEQEPVAQAMTKMMSPAVVAMLEPNKQAINQKKAAELKQTILEKAYITPAKNSAAQEEASGNRGSDEAGPEGVNGSTLPAEVVAGVASMPENVILPGSATAGRESGQNQGVKVAAGMVEEVQVQVKAGNEVAEPASLPAGEISVIGQTGGAGAVTAPEPEKSVDDNGQGVAAATKPTSAVSPVVAPSEPTSRETAVDRVPSFEPNKVVLGLQPNSLDLTSEAAGEYEAFVQKLKNYPQAKLLVKGFVSAKTNSPENIKLSEDRAMGVQKLLVKSGIEPTRIVVKGLGNQEPVAPNNTSEGRAKNRRVEIVVVHDGQ